MGLRIIKNSGILRDSRLIIESLGLGLLVSFNEMETVKGAVSKKLEYWKNLEKSINDIILDKHLGTQIS